jgi:hypothetical protein
VVVVRVVIDSAGNPQPATAVVVQGCDSVLVAAARTLVLKTWFRPARVRGRVVQALVEVPVEFSAASLPAITLHIAGDVYGEAARFTPGRIAGRAVRVRFAMPVEFTLPTRN